MDKRLYQLAEQVGAALKARTLMLATAESCTGGWIGAAITAVPGSSDWYELVFITYSYVSKREMLGVKAKTLQKFGAVSEQTVTEMAGGGLAPSYAHRAGAGNGT